MVIKSPITKTPKIQCFSCLSNNPQPNEKERFEIGIALEYPPETVDSEKKLACEALDENVAFMCECNLKCD